MKRLWPTHKFICNKHTQAMLDPTMALMYAMDDPVYAASLVRLGNHEGERPDFWLVLPAGVQALLPQYMDVKSLCRTDSIMTNVLAREAWNIALKGSESVALSKWPRYSSLDKFKSLRWSKNRRVALEGIKLWRVVDSKAGGVLSWLQSGEVCTNVGKQFMALCGQPKFVDIAVMLVESRSIDPNMEIVIAGGSRCTPLYIASGKGHLPVVQALLQAGAAVDKAADDGRTPLLVASQNGHLPVVQALLQAGAAVDKAADDGGTPLLIASQKSRLPVVLALLQAGADVDKAADGGATPLLTASEKGHLPVVQALLQAGAAVDKALDDGRTPLYMASQNGHLPVVQALLQAGAAVDKALDNGITPLFVASDKGHLPVVQALLQAGADVDKALDGGITPVLVARYEGHTEIVRLLEGVTQRLTTIP
jgi:ankyrin repeat protein